MIDLKVYKSEKQTQSALGLVDAFVETRNLFEEVKKIAECENSSYTQEQKIEAQELTKNGFIEFVSTMMKMNK